MSQSQPSQPVHQRKVALVAPPGEDTTAYMRVVAIARQQMITLPENATLSPQHIGCLIVHAFVSEPGQLLSRGAQMGLPVILSCAPMPSLFAKHAADWDEHSIERALALRAHAYVWRIERLDEAIRFVLGENRAERVRGFRRLTYLGRSGADRSVGDGPPIGSYVPVSPREGGAVRIGRSTEVEACLQAPSVAKEHCKIVTSQGRTFVIDQNSKNGTWLHTGATATRIPPGVPEAIGPGEELIIAGFFRFRLDGGQ